jgi:magnesium-transporting ATPase (P-type)
LLSDQKVQVDERQCSVGDKLIHKPKDANDPFLMANSYVTSGFCKALVACVGSHSTRGMYESSFDESKEKTELTQKLSNLSKSFTYLGCLFAVVILSAGIGIQII